MNLQSDHLSESLTRNGKEMVAGRRRDAPGRLDDRDAYKQGFAYKFAALV
jgi:hypothetical protein